MFSVRPLFAALPVESDEELGRATTKLARALRKHLDSLAKRARHDAVDNGLGDWTFNPDLREHMVAARVDLRSRTAVVRFPAVTFAAFGRTVGCVPVLDDLWFDVLRGADVKTRARDAVRDHLRRLEHDADEPGEFQVPEAFTASTRAWVSSVELDVRPRPKVDAGDTSSRT